MEKHAQCCDEQCVHTQLVDKVLQELPDEDALYDLAELFKVFGDSTRVRILFALFIALPILSLTLEPGKTVDDFSKELEKKGGEFREKTGEEQDKILEEVDTSISDLREKLKLEKKEERKEKIFDLLKKGLELTRYLKIKACSKEDKNYENCRKKRCHGRYFKTAESAA